MTLFKSGDRVRIVGVARGIGGMSLVGQCGTVHEVTYRTEGVSNFASYSVRVGNWDGSMTWCNLDEEDIERVSAWDEYANPLLLLSFVVAASGLLLMIELGTNSNGGAATGVALAGVSAAAMWSFSIWQVRRASIR